MKNLLNALKNKIFVRTLLIVLAIGIIFGTTLFLLKTTSRVSIENSLVDAPITSLSATVPGKLISVDVIEGQKVKKGDVLGVVGSEVIRSYSDGIVSNTNQQIGSIVSAQVPVVQMIDTTQMRINGTIDENKGLNQIKIGQVVSFTVDALPGKTFWGYVDEVGESAKQTQAAFSISGTRPTQQFEVFAKFNSEQYPEIKNGMSAKMTVFTK